MKKPVSYLTVITTALISFGSSAYAAGSPEGIQGYMLRAAVDRGDIAGRDWENPVELIAFSKPAPAPAPEPEAAPAPAPEPSPAPGPAPEPEAAPAPAPEPSPSPAPAPEPEAAPVTAGALPCEEYSRFANTWVAETVRISWTDEQKDQFCGRLKVVSLYETLWTDFFGMTAQQMFPENTAPNIVYRERLGNTIPHMHMDITGEVLRFDMDYVVGYVDETGLLDFPNVTTVTVEYLESRAAQFGYCANNFERGIPLQDYYQSDVPVEGWYWRCDILLTNDQYPNYGIALYHPNRAVPSWFRVEVVSSNADSSASISVNFRDNSSGWRLN